MGWLRAGTVPTVAAAGAGTRHASQPLVPGWIFSFTSRWVRLLTGLLGFPPRLGQAPLASSGALEAMWGQALTRSSFWDAFGRCVFVGDRVTKLLRERLRQNVSLDLEICPRLHGPIRSGRVQAENAGKTGALWACLIGNVLSVDNV